MDSVSHLVAGALTPLSFLRVPKRIGIVIFGILAGELPDYDVFFEVGTTYGLLSLHRGITHAIVWQPILALFLVLPFYVYFAATKPKGTVRFTHLFMLALLGLYIHLFLDCMTTFGTQVFLPFSQMRVWLSSMFIVDFTLLIPSSIFLCISLYYYFTQKEKTAGAIVANGSKGAGQGINSLQRGVYQSLFFARLGLGWMLLYPLLSLGVSTVTAKIFEPVAAAHNAPHVELLTEPFSPFVWKVVAETPEEYLMGTYYMGNAPSSVAFTSYKKVDPALYNGFAQHSALFRQYADFCSFLVQTKALQPVEVHLPHYSGKLIHYSFMDVRYIISAHSPARFFGRTDTNFVLEALATQEGRLVAHRFLNRSSLVKTPWVYEPLHISGW